MAIISIHAFNFAEPFSVPKEWTMLRQTSNIEYIATLTEEIVPNFRSPGHRQTSFPAWPHLCLKIV